MKRKIIPLIVLSIISIVILIFYIYAKKDNKYTLEYKGNTYVYLEFNNDIFTYNYNDDKYLDVEEIYSVPHKKWDMIYCEGDLFVLDKQIKEATKYYRDENNYEWSIIIEADETEEEYPIKISDKELKYLNNIDNIENKETMKFSDIEKFGTLKKTSKDKIVSGVTLFAYTKNYWFYKTEVMTGDLEYIVRIPKTLNDKIENFKKSDK